MINFIGTSPKVAISKIGINDYVKHCAYLTTPRNGANPSYAVSVGASWAMDNGAFSGFNADKFMQALIHWRYIPRCKFCVTPDAVGDATLTMTYFWIWQPILKAFNYPVAFVLQNGMSEYQIPWAYIDCLFIGGDDAFKYSRYISNVVKDAKKRNVWVHMGRVNSRSRIQYACSIGCDSFDGSGYAMFPHRIEEELNDWKQVKPLPYQLPLLADVC